MNEPNSDAGRIEDQLRKLTTRQCQVLFWVCHGLTFREVAAKINYGEDVVTLEMSRIYRLFAFTGLTRPQKRHLLVNLICPIHLRMVSDPKKDCAAGVIDATPPLIDQPTLKEVIDDEQRGLIPLDIALIHVSQTGPGEPPGAEGGQKMMTQVPPPYSRQNPLPWILVGVLGTLLFVAVAGITVLLTQQTGGSATPATAIAAVPATQVPQASPPTAPPQATYTPLPTLTPYPSQLPPTQPVIVAPRSPIVVTATPSADVQDPPPGSTIASGSRYSLRNIIVLTEKQPLVTGAGDILSIVVYVRNNRSESYILRLSSEIFHLRDDTGRQYPIKMGGGLPSPYQFTISPNTQEELIAYKMGGNLISLGFQGRIPANARYLVFTIDELAGMTNLNWRFDLQ